MTNTMQLFLRDIGDAPRYTRKEERALAQTMARGQEAELRISQTEDDREKRRLQKRLAGQIAAGIDARNKLAESVLPWAVLRAKQFSKKTPSLASIELEDLVQEASGAVLDALKPDRFNPEHGRLTTYVAWWIFQRLQRYVCNNRHAIRLPSYVVAGGSQDADSDCHAAADAVKAGIVSLNACNEETGRSGVELIEAPDTFSEMIEADDRRHHVRVLRSLIRNLPEREKFVLYSRMHGDTLGAIGRCLEITRERVRQIEARAIRRVREKYEKRIEREGRRHLVAGVA